MRAKIAIGLLASMAILSSAAAQQGPSIKMDGVLLNTDPQPLESGEDGEIRFKVRNTGSAADNVEVEVLDSYPFSLRPDTRRNYTLGEVGPNEEYFITSEVLVAEDSPDGLNDFKLRISSGDFSQVEEIPVTVQSENIELNLANLKTSPSSLKPDTDDAKMTVEVVNNGDKTAENVVLEIGLPQAFTPVSSFSKRQSLGNIESGETKEAEFSFDIEENAEKGEISIPANLSYSAGDSTNRINQESDFSFYLAGKPQFKIVNSSSQLGRGDSGKIELTVRNTGSEKSSSTRVRVLDSSDQPFSYSSANQYVGTLEPGQTGTAVFDVTTESDASLKEYLIDFEVRGVKDTEVFVEEKTLEAEVESGEGGSNSLVLVLGLLAAIGVVLYIFRERILERLN